MASRGALLSFGDKCSSIRAPFAELDSEGVHCEIIDSGWLDCGTFDCEEVDCKGSDEQGVVDEEAQGGGDGC